MRTDLSFLIKYPGAVGLVDGQYGSTGKGVVASAIAQDVGMHFGIVTSNAGPNSGHTSFWRDHQIVLKQLPTLAVQTVYRHGVMPLTYLNAGAVIDREILEREVRNFLGRDFHSRVMVHPVASEINEGCKNQDAANVDNIASTGQGVGPALQFKLGRHMDAVIGSPHKPPSPWFSLGNLMHRVNDISERVFVEVSQGFSLGLNQSRFYPCTTTRECTIGQALSDAGIAPSRLRHTIMALRTYPIRVGNTSGSSGGNYPDQQEIQWQDIGIEPEFTTVTGRQRRVFTWSNMQYIDALVANTPSVIFLNFINYLPVTERRDFIVKCILEPYLRVLNMRPLAVLVGNGPLETDVHSVNIETGEILYGEGNHTQVA